MYIGERERSPLWFILVILLLMPVGWIYALYHTEDNSLELCKRMCNSKGQDYSELLRYSWGGCMCDTREGRKMDKGCMDLINNRCKQ